MSQPFFRNINNPLTELRILTEKAKSTNHLYTLSNNNEVSNEPIGTSTNYAWMEEILEADEQNGSQQSVAVTPAETPSEDAKGYQDISKHDAHESQTSDSEQIVETEFLINQMVEDLDQAAFRKLKEIMTQYDDVDGMKPHDFINLWNSLIKPKYPEKIYDKHYQQRIMDMFRQIDFDQDGRLTFEEFSGNLVACQRQLSTQFATYDESPVVISNPHISPDKLIFLPTFNKIISCGKPEHSCLWNIRDGTLEKKIEGHHATVHNALHIPERGIFLTTSADRTMIAYDSRTLKKKRQIPTKVAQLCMVFDRNTKRMYSGGTDSAIHVWNMDDFSETRTFKGPNAHTDFVMDLCMLETLNLLISCSLDKTIKLWDTRSLKCKHTKHGHLKGITGLTYSKKYKVLVSYGCEKHAYLWNTLSTSCIFRFEGHSRPLVGAHIVEDTPELITVDISGIVIIWNVRTYRAVQKLRPPNVEFARFRSFCYDSFTKQIITSGDHEMNYWKSIHSETQVAGINHAVVQIRFNRVFKQVLTGVRRFLTVWKSGNGHLHKQYPVSDSNITDLIILGQWRNAAVSTVDGEVKMISLMDGTVSKSISLKDEIRGLFRVEKELQEEDKDHLIVPTLKGDMYRIDLYKEQIVSVHKSSLKNCTISGSAYSERFKLLATISGDVIEVWRPFYPDRAHQQVETGEDTTACCFVDEWNCFVTIDMSGSVKLFSMPSFRHLLTIRIDLPLPSKRSRKKTMQNPTSLSLIHHHAKQETLVVSSTYHITLLNVRWLAEQCQAELDRKSITSKGQTTLYRNRIIVLKNYSSPIDPNRTIHAFDTELKTLCNAQFFSMDEFSRIKEIINTGVLSSSRFITHHFEAFEPTSSETSKHIEDYGCVLTEHSVVTLEKYLKHQELRIDETRWLTVCIVNAIHELHSKGFVINNLCAKNIARVDRTWKLINLHKCQPEGKSFLKKHLDYHLYSPEYAAQAQEGNHLIARQTHDIWCFATLLLRLTTKRIFVDESMSHSMIEEKLLKGSQRAPVFSITFEDVIDVTPRNVLRHILVRHAESRWSIFQIMKHMETSGALSQQSPPPKQRIITDDEDDDSDSEDESDDLVNFPKLLENQAYDPFEVDYDNGNVLVSNIPVISAEDGKITATCVVDDPPLIITSAFKKSYQEGHVYMYDFKGNRMGTLPCEEKRDTWTWPDVHDTPRLYYPFEPKPSTNDNKVQPVNHDTEGVTNVSTPPTTKHVRGRAAQRAVWQDDSSSDDSILEEILNESSPREEPLEQFETNNNVGKRNRLKIRPKLKVSFKGRRLQAASR